VIEVLLEHVTNLREKLKVIFLFPEDREIVISDVDSSVEYQLCLINALS